MQKREKLIKEQDRRARKRETELEEARRIGEEADADLVETRDAVFEMKRKLEKVQAERHEDLTSQENVIRRIKTEKEQKIASQEEVIRQIQEELEEKHNNENLRGRPRQTDRSSFMNEINNFLGPKNTSTPNREIQ